VARLRKKYQMMHMEKEMVNAAFVHGVIAIAMLHLAKKKNRTPLLAISCKKHSTQLSIIFPS
jgi:hypothetical protein